MVAVEHSSRCPLPERLGHQFARVEDPSAAATAGRDAVFPRNNRDVGPERDSPALGDRGDTSLRAAGRGTRSGSIVCVAYSKRRYDPGLVERRCGSKAAVQGGRRVRRRGYSSDSCRRNHRVLRGGFAIGYYFIIKGNRETLSEMRGERLSGGRPQVIIEASLLNLPTIGLVVRNVSRGRQGHDI